MAQKIRDHVKKHYKLALLLSIIALIAIFGTSKTFSLVTTYDSPDIKLTEIHQGNSFTDFWDDTSWSGKVSTTEPNVEVEIAQPVEKDCLNTDYGTSKLCLIKDDILNTLKLNNDKVETHRYTYKFFIFYRTSQTGLGYKYDADNYQFDWRINYKDLPHKFKYLSVVDFHQCTENDGCKRISITPITGNTLSLGNDYTTFSTFINVMPANTDASQLFEFQIDTDVKFENFYADFNQGTLPLSDQILDKFNINDPTDQLFTKILNIGLLFLLLIAGFILVLAIGAALIRRVVG